MTNKHFFFQFHETFAFDQYEQMLKALNILS